jgi:hypothetical protein
LALQVGVASSGAGQTVPHFKQFEVSVLRSTQELPQAVSVPPQSVVHAPSKQTLPLGQTVVQSPQCWPSALVSTQVPLQSL